MGFLKFFGLGDFREQGIEGPGGLASAYEQQEVPYHTEQVRQLFERAKENPIANPAFRDEFVSTLRALNPYVAQDVAKNLIGDVKKAAPWHRLHIGYLLDQANNGHQPEAMTRLATEALRPSEHEGRLDPATVIAILQKESGITPAPEHNF